MRTSFGDRFEHHTAWERESSVTFHQWWLMRHATYTLSWVQSTVSVDECYPVITCIWWRCTVAKIAIITARGDRPWNSLTIGERMDKNIALTSPTRRSTGLPLTTPPLATGCASLSLVWSVDMFAKRLRRTVCLHVPMLHPDLRAASGLHMLFAPSAYF